MTPIYSEEKIVLIPRTNAGKYFSYREAWERIGRAITQGFYLEAVTLEESIISDRLCSYFCKIGTLDSEKLKHRHPSLAELIKLWNKHEPEPISDPIRNPRFYYLQESLDVWRAKRNHVVHGIVKSSGECHDDILNFIQEAERVARDGELVAKSVANWCRRYTDRQKSVARRLEREAAMGVAAVRD